MKKTAFILAFLACFISYQGIAQTNPNPESNTTSQAAADRILVTPQIVQFILQKNANQEGLKFYPSNKLSLELNEKKVTEEIKKENGMIILNTPIVVNELKEIEISKDSEGILTGFPEPADKGNKLQISFQDVNFIFIRNKQQNCYELFEVNAANKEPINKFSELILLYVSGQDNRKVQAVSKDLVNGNEQPSQKPSTGSNANFSSYIDSTDSAIFSTKIVSTGSLKYDKVLSYVRDKKNPLLSHMDIAVIDSYFKLAGSINVDIAIAQMLYYTDFFRKTERVKTCNYGGLSNTPPNFNGDFKGQVTDGIKAHIQHLRAYAHEPSGLQEKIVDPRYDIAYKLGKQGIDFGQVSGYWSVNPDYGQEIADILRDLYRYSGAQ